MRFSKLLLTAAAAGALAWTAAAAQDQPPPEPEAKAEQPRLPELEVTLEGLTDEPAPEEEAAAADQPPAEDEPAAEQAPSEPAPAEAAPPAQAGPPQPLTRAQRASLDEAVLRGRQLIAIAQAGLLATQDMLSRVADPEGAGIEGWIAEPEGNGMAVTFFGDGEDGPAAIYRARLLGGRVVSRDVFLGDSRPALSPFQARLAAARAAAAALDHQACGAQGFNYLIVPPAAPDAPIDVYQVTARSQPGQFPFGGHFRTTVNAEGAVTAARGFTNACLDVAVPEAAAGAQPAPLALAHLLDPLPTEIHVFMALWTGRPILVATGNPESEEAERVWLVTGERIAEIRR